MEVTCVEQCVYIKIAVLRDRKAMECHSKLVEALGNNTLPYHTVMWWEREEKWVIRCNRLRWLGHIWRSPENNQTRAYTFKNPMGSQTRGRPPTRWIYDVENDLKTLNIKNWQRVAAYRWNWRKRAVEAAKTCNRLLRL
ncbi:endonuclease-reverse transcriptase [Trichonephila clavipes]|nr:endonuclease-reverse transcriptase [Trichonephila clavipes]